MTLIELMVALAIGAFLMIGAITVFMQSRTTFRITESVSRLQENARFALDVLEPDIRMAHYWGLTTRDDEHRRTGARADGRPTASGPRPAATTGSINLDEAVERHATTATASACAGTRAASRRTADTLVVRRASEDPERRALTHGQHAAHSERSRHGQLARSSSARRFPAGFNAATSETHRLIVNGYYVSRTRRSLGRGVPSLRVQDAA